METERDDLFGYYLKWYYPGNNRIEPREIFYVPCNLWYSVIESIESDLEIAKGRMYREDSLRRFDSKTGAKVYIPFVNIATVATPKYRSDRSLKELFGHTKSFGMADFRVRRATVHGIQDIINYHRLVVRSTLRRDEFIVVDSREVSLEHEERYVYVV